jgi:hypothetical protein
MLWITCQKSASMHTSNVKAGCYKCAAGRHEGTRSPLHTCSFLIALRCGRSGRAGASAAARLDKSNLNSGSGASWCQQQQQQQQQWQHDS